MEKGSRCRGFFTKTFVGVLMFALVINAPMIASEKRTYSDEVNSEEISPESIIIDSGFTPPSNTHLGSLEISLEETSIPIKSRDLTFSPQNISLLSNPVSLRNPSQTPRNRGNFGFIHSSFNNYYSKNDKDYSNKILQYYSFI